MPAGSSPDCPCNWRLNLERSIGLDFLFTITFFAPRLDIVGNTPYGKRILANVDGGHFEGPNIKGTVQPPAGDWLNQLLAAGTGQRFPDRGVYDIHQII